jgi:hypothetical protein
MVHNTFKEISVSKNRWKLSFSLFLVCITTLSLAFNPGCRPIASIDSVIMNVKWKGFGRKRPWII